MFKSNIILEVKECTMSITANIFTLSVAVMNQEPFCTHLLEVDCEGNGSKYSGIIVV